MRDAIIIEITRDHVTYRVDGSERRVGADTVVIASEVEAGSTLADELRALGIEVHVVGDGAAVGYIEGAFYTAWPVATAL